MIFYDFNKYSGGKIIKIMIIKKAAKKISFSAVILQMPSK